MMNYRVTAIGANVHFDFETFNEAVKFFKGNFEMLEVVVGTAPFIASLTNEDEDLHYPAVWRNGEKIYSRY